MKTLITLIIFVALTPIVHAQVSIESLQTAVQFEYQTFQTKHSPLCTPTSFSLKLGSNNLSVQCLQKLLNSNPDTIVATGTTAGAWGHETTYFGVLTREAVKKHQSLYQLPITGISDATTTQSIMDMSYEASNVTTLLEDYQKLINEYKQLNM